MENRINKDVLEVPMDFRIACESFGIQVADFLQLLVDHFTFVNLFAEEESVYNLVVKSFTEAEGALEKIGGYNTNYSLSDSADESMPLFQQLVKLAINRNYSWNTKRSRSKKIVDKLFLITSKNIETKSIIYLNEETPIRLNQDLRMWSVIHNFPIIPLLNAIMKKVSLADLYARDHLGKIEYNAALGVYLKVQEGYGNLRDRKHLSSEGFRLFLEDLQEFKMRYFLYHRLPDRVELYRDQFLKNFNEMNKTNII